MQIELYIFSYINEFKCIKYICILNDDWYYKKGTSFVYIYNYEFNKIYIYFNFCYKNILQRCEFKIM